MIVTLTAVALGLKWLAGGVATGVGSYKACRFVCAIPEVTLDDDAHAHAAAFERYDPGMDAAQARAAGMPEGYTHEFVLGGEGFNSDAMHRRGAAAGLGRGKDQEGTAFIRYWVAQLRVEFPARMDRPSDRAAMSKWLANQLRTRGVRITHMADIIPRCVALALNQSRAEVEAMEMADAARIRTWGSRWVHTLKRHFRVRGDAAPVPLQ